MFDPDRLLPMDAAIRNVDLADGRVLVDFADGTSTLFDAEFLKAHRDDNGNQALLPEEE
jgi:hypothetical protein